MVSVLEFSFFRTILFSFKINCASEISLFNSTFLAKLVIETVCHKNSHETKFGRSNNDFQIFADLGALKDRMSHLVGSAHT